jgi:hypothetical protein
MEPSPAKVTDASTMTEDIRWSIGSFGKDIMVLCPMDIAYIIRMETNSTTISPTLSYLLRLLTNESTQGASFGMVNGGSPVRIAGRCNTSLSITSGKAGYILGVRNVVSGTR